VAKISRKGGKIVTFSTPFWSPLRHIDRRPFLLLRARLLLALRHIFAQQGFLEVETPVLQVSPGNETHLHGFATQALTPQGEAYPLMLRTSPEFTLKKLLAAGETQIVEFATVFRNRERGILHHPQFLMLEWYRARQPLSALYADCQRILALAAEIAGREEVHWQGRKAFLTAPPVNLTVTQAFEYYAGIDLETCLGENGTPLLEPLRSQAQARGFRVAADDSWSDLFSRILTQAIEPHLGDGQATFLERYPLPEAALARPCEDDPRFCERFELYLCGIELANAFGELTDAQEQRRRFENAMTEKQRLYGETYPLDEDFLACLPSLPPCCGAAMGLERLMLLAFGAQKIEQVMAAPVADRP
jgi:elongation factor P--(R)-beta-lysine ligase